MAIKLVNAQRARKLVDRLGAEGFSSTTIAQYLVLLRKLLAHAVLMAILAEVPALPRVKVRSQPRGAFGVGEYRPLVAVARAFRGQPHPVLASLGKGDRFWIARELLHMPDELPWLIRWMVNTFVRPSDIKEVKHGHIEVVRGRHLSLRMRLPETKRHSQPMVSLRAAVHVYEALLSHQRQQGFGGPDDYLFLPHVRDRGQALAIEAVPLDRAARPAADVAAALRIGESPRKKPRVLRLGAKSTNWEGGGDNRCASDCALK